MADPGISCNPTTVSRVVRPSEWGWLSGNPAAVIECPRDALAEDASLAVWVEVMPDRGPPRRIPTPFLKPILAQDGVLTLAYHTTSPASDQALLRLLVEAGLQALGGGSIIKRRTRAAFVARRILPDVLHYEPGAPTGFTFAAQNGRHPTENAGRIAAAIIAGTLV